MYLDGSTLFKLAAVAVVLIIVIQGFRITSRGKKNNGGNNGNSGNSSNSNNSGSSGNSNAK